jgi:hypothetical protein
VPLYGQRVTRSDSVRASSRTSSGGMYQRVGRPVSNRAVGRSVSASSAPSSSTRTWRSLGIASTRFDVSRAWTKTSVASSNHWTLPSHGNV